MSLIIEACDGVKIRAVQFQRLKNTSQRHVTNRQRFRVCLQITLIALFFAMISGCSEEKVAGVQLEITGTIKDEAEVSLAGATVTFDDNPVGETPITLTDVEPGPHLVEVELPGFHPEWDTIHVSELPLEQTAAIELRRLEGVVTVESTPSPAQVRLDYDTIIGDTPLIKAKIPAGTRTLQVEYENYVTAEMTFEVEPDFIYTKAFELKPKNGTLRVFSIPTGASYWLNNRKQTEETPAVLDLIPGTYRIGVYAPGYVMKEQVIELVANDDKSIDLTLQEGAVPEGMVIIPAGEFTMGFDDESPDERPARSIMVDTFYIDKYEVTNAQYKEVVTTHTFKKGDKDVPVAGVTWEQATDYARKIGKRLPTEAEWEKAARGEDGRTWPWGNDFVPRYTSHASGSSSRLRDVGSFDEGMSPYGCFDMAGNVREWTQSWYQAYPGNEEVKADYGQVYRVLRGGSYLTGSFDVRTVRRHYERMDLSEIDFGFRCAADVSTPSARRQK
jgi:formylglycine-generating enzyme required for sulfatase activity